MNEILAWAKALMTQDDWCILDTETTGLGDTDEICDICIIDGKTDVVLVNTLVRPTKRISEVAMATHGITHEHLVGAPSFVVAFGLILEALSKYKKVITYNADFDERMLRQSAFKSGINLFMSEQAEQFMQAWQQRFSRHVTMECYALPLTWECLMKKYAVYYGGPRGRWQTLQAACQQQQVSPEALAYHRWHRAWGDCMAARQLIMALAAKADVSESPVIPSAVESQTVSTSVRPPGVEVFDIEKGRIDL